MNSKQRTKNIIFTGLGITCISIGLTHKYAQRLENTREMNRVMNIRRELFSEQFNACRTVYYGDKNKIDECANKAHIQIFGEETEAERKQFRIDNSPDLMYDLYVKWKTRS